MVKLCYVHNNDLYYNKNLVHNTLYFCGHIKTILKFVDMKPSDALKSLILCMFVFCYIKGQIGFVSLVG